MVSLFLGLHFFAFAAATASPSPLSSIHKAIEHDNVAVFPTFFTAMDWCETQLIRSVASYEDDSNQASFWATSHFSRRESFR